MKRFLREERHCSSQAHIMKNCCDICGDVGVGEALISCSRCQSSSEHKYCMRTLVKGHLDHWLREDCESSSKPMSVASFATLSKLANCVENCKGAVLLTDSRKLMKESREVSIDWEEKAPTGKTNYISAEEPATVSAEAMNSRLPSNVTSNSSLRKPKIEVHFSYELDPDSGPFQKLETQRIGTVEISEPEQSQSEKHTDMPPKLVEDQPEPIVSPSTAGNPANAPTQKRETRTKNQGDRLRKYIEEKGRIPVIFHKKDGHPVGKYTRIFMTELGVAVKKFAPLQVSSWRKITEKQKRPIFDQLKSAFVLDFGIGPSSVRKETDKLMSVCYRNNRVKMHKHYKTLTELPWEDRLKQVPKEYCNSEEDWEFLCTMFESRTFKDQSAVNSTNRANLLCTYHGGSKSLVQYTYEHGDVPRQKDHPKKVRIKKHRVKKTDIGTQDVGSQSMEEVDVVDQACDQVPGKRRGYMGGDGNGPTSAKSTPDATSCEATNSGLRDELASTKNELHITQTALKSAEDKIQMLEANQKRLEEIIQANKQIGEANQRMMMQVFERIAPGIVQSLTQQPSSAAPPSSSL